MCSVVWLWPDCTCHPDTIIAREAKQVSNLGHQASWKDLRDHSSPVVSHRQLKKVGMISISRVIAWYAQYLHTPYSSRVVHDRKEERQKKEKGRKRLTKSKFLCLVFSNLMKVSITNRVVF